MEPKNIIRDNIENQLINNGWIKIDDSFIKGNKRIGINVSDKIVVVLYADGRLVMSTPVNKVDDPALEIIISGVIKRI